MKITVDTKNDNPDQIREVIRVLSSFVKKSKQLPIQKPVTQVAQPKNKESLVSFEVFSSNEHSPGLIESTNEVSGMFTDNKEEEVKIKTPTVVEKVEQDKPSYKQVTY